MTDWKARAALHQGMVGKVPSGSESVVHETLALMCAELAELVPQEKALEEWVRFPQEDAKPPASPAPGQEVR